MLRPGEMACLDAQNLADLFSGIRVRPDIDAHLDACAACRALVAAYAKACDDAFDLSDTHPAAEHLSGHELASGMVLYGRYVLDAVLGEGGMGVVWSALDRTSDREVALKIVRDASEELKRRSWREARLASHVSHPTIVEVLDVFTLRDEGPPILVMPRLHGESLDVWMKRVGKAPTRDACGILAHVARGVRAAHLRGVIHRDLKPQNIFLAQDAPGAVPVPMVLDFGLAKMLSADGSDEAADKLTRTGALVGTPYYMAPEQLFGDARIGPAADVWALGAVLYECLTATRPLAGRSYAQLVRSATKGRIAPVRESAPHVTTSLESLVHHMLSFDDKARPDMGSVLLALESEAGGEAKHAT